MAGGSLLLARELGGGMSGGEVKETGIGGCDTEYINSSAGVFARCESINGLTLMVNAGLLRQGMTLRSSESIQGCSC